MIAGVALAAGRGERMRPLTDQRPKVLMPVGATSLLDRTLTALAARVGRGPQQLAVNAHHLAAQVGSAVGERALLSLEQPEALGTAGALGQLRPWLDGRDVLVANADVYAPDGLPDLADGWDGERCRLLVVPVEAGRRADFVLPNGSGVRYVGLCLLPWTAVRHLEPVPSGLYEVLWRDLVAPDQLDLLVAPSGRSWIDCGTPDDYLAANLHASDGRSVVGAGAVVEGTLDECVVWPGAHVAASERLHRVVRAGTRAAPVTVRTTVEP